MDSFVNSSKTLDITLIICYNITYKKKRNQMLSIATLKFIEQTLTDYKIKLDKDKLYDFEKTGTIVVSTTAPKEKKLKEDVLLTDVAEVTEFDKNLTRVTVKGVELNVLQRAKEIQGTI